MPQRLSARRPFGNALWWWSVRAWKSCAPCWSGCSSPLDPPLTEAMRWRSPWGVARLKRSCVACASIGSRSVLLGPITLFPAMRKEEALPKKTTSRNLLQILCASTITVLVFSHSSAVPAWLD
jgi:hypothetical protein